MRAFVSVGDAAPRWYRSLNEARHDARDLAGGAAVGDVLARAWVAKPDPGDDATPDYELRVGGRGALTWYRTAEEPQPQPATA
jgi:hypothetical protein